MVGEENKAQQDIEAVEALDLDVDVTIFELVPPVVMARVRGLQGNRLSEETKSKAFGYFSKKGFAFLELDSRFWVLGCFYLELAQELGELEIEPLKELNSRQAILGRLRDSIVTCEKILKIEPDNNLYRMDIAETFLKLREPDQAVEFLTERLQATEEASEGSGPAKERAEERADMFNLLGQAYRMANEPLKMNSSYAQAHALNPQKYSKDGTYDAQYQAKLEHSIKKMIEAARRRGP